MNQNKLISYNNRLTVLFVLGILFTAGVAYCGTYASGDGTEEDPYQISTAGHIQELGENPDDWSSRFIVTVDIDLSTYTVEDFVTIGNETTYFTGVFDGNGFILRGLSIEKEGTEQNTLALFGRVARSAQISNLTVENFQLTANGYQYLAALAAFNLGTITNCHASGTITGDIAVGGIAGYNNGNIISSSSSVNVTGTKYVGSLVGHYYYDNDFYCSISDCFSTGSVAGIESAGGLTGFNHNGKIINCYAAGNVTGQENTGGLVGYDYLGRTENCFAQGIVSGVYRVGGLTGFNYDGVIKQCIVLGVVSGEEAVGGVAGFNRGDILNCYTTGDVSGDLYVGGLIGHDYYGEITNCYTTAVVTCTVAEPVGNELVAALIGRNNMGTYKGCFWDTDLYTDMKGVGLFADPSGVMGRTTDEMHDRDTYTDKGWDFAGESANGSYGIWKIEPGGCPRLGWEVIPLIRSDFNGDETNDILWFRISNQSMFVTLVDEGDVGEFLYTGGGVGYGIWNVGLSGDFNGDETTDMIWWSEHSGAYFVRLMQDGVPGEHLYLGGVGDPGIRLIGVGDFNGDGTTDLLWHRQAENVHFVTLVNEGVPGEFQYVGGGGDHDIKIVGLGDFNADGVTDILWRRDLEGATFITLVKDAVPGPYDYVGWGGDPDISVIELGDFDGNGTTDYLSRRDDDSSVWLTLLEGADAEEPYYVGAGGDPNLVVVDVGDFDGNGTDDLVWRRNSGVHFIMLMDGSIPGPYEYIGGNDMGMFVIEASDFNGDMKADLLWWKESNNVHFITLMEGTTRGELHYAGGGDDFNIWAIILEDEALWEIYP